jgi:hypothetical protein
MNARALRTCTRCQQSITVTPSGHLRAHTCPHGDQCVVPYNRRRLGEKPAHCGVCLGARDARLEPGQLPIPFHNGIRPALRRPPSKRTRARQRWRLPGGGYGRPCPGCGCDEFRRCRIELPDVAGVAECLPAGSFGRKLCSACRQPSLPGIAP